MARKELPWLKRRHCFGQRFAIERGYGPHLFSERVIGAQRGDILQGRFGGSAAIEGTGRGQGLSLAPVDARRRPPRLLVVPKAVLHLEETRACGKH